MLLSAIGVGGSVVGWLWWSQWRHLETTDDAYLHSDITTISPKVAGHVAEVAVEDNQAVAAGDVLLRLDGRDYAARLAEAEAAVAARRAAIANLETRLVLQKAVIAQAAALVAGSEADLRRTRQDHERTAKLLKEDWVSRQRFDLTEADAAKAKAGVSGAMAQVEAARRQLAVLESERDMAEANLKQAEAAAAVARADVEHTVLRAPVAGVVGNRAAQVGQYVRPGQALLAVVPLDEVWVEANFKETQIAAMRPGQPVEIEIDAFAGQAVKGRLDSVSPASGAKFSLLPPENATGNFTKVVQRVPVKIVLEAGNPLDGRLRPGLSAVVTVDTRAADPQVTVARR
jgi:membrane fusion protein (multidrug efflux system)